MFKVIDETTLRSKKATIMTTIISAILVTILSIPIAPNTFALDLDNFGIDDIGQSAECIIVVVRCDGTGSVGSSGDTIIGSNNGNDDNNTNEPTTLTVSKEIICESIGGSPNDEVVCDYAEGLAVYPTPDDYEFTVRGNNPNPATFEGSSTGTALTIGAGAYEIDESASDLNTNGNQVALGAAFVSIKPTGATGDCNYTGPSNPVATGTMTTGSSQECTIVNTVLIASGRAPEAL